MADANPTELAFPLPVKGVYQTGALHEVPAGFSVYANNCLPYDPTTGRNTPAQRPGTAKFFPTSGTNALNFGDGTNGAIVQYIGQVTVQDTSGGTTANKLMIVSGGRAYLQLPTDTVLNRIDTPTNVATFSPGRRVSHDIHQNISRFSDGLVAKQYDHTTGIWGDWTASTGTFPIAGSRYPRYIRRWRGRMVLAYLEKGAPGLWFMSAMNDPTDFNYSSTNGATAAVASNSNFRAGQMGEVVNAIIPMSEDVLLFGLDHSLYEMRGDPGAGGSLMPISETIGVLQDDAWCIAEGGVLYFMSNVGFCRYAGGTVQVLSDEGFKETYKNLPQIGYFIEVEYDAKRSLVWIFVTKSTSPFTTIHSAYDLRAERLYGAGAGFWPQSFPVDTGGDDQANGTTAPKHGPTKACVFDGGTGTNSARTVLLGCRDGYIRAIDDTAIGSDDGTAISSAMWLGPMRPAGSFQEFLINGHMPILGPSTNTAATWRLIPGTDPYSASNNAGTSLEKTGTFTTGGRQGVLGDRVMANSVFATVANSTLGKTWAVQQWTAAVAAGGPVR